MTSATPYRSNCLLEAWRHYRALRRQGHRVALFIRPSDVEDSGLLIHVGWQIYDAELQVYRPASFRPLSFEPRLPLLKRLTRLLFVGRIQHHDDPPPPKALAAGHDQNNTLANRS